MCVCSMCGSWESSEVTGGRSRRQFGWGRLRPQSQHVRFRAVGQAHSTWEAIDRGFFNHARRDRGPREKVEERGLAEGNLFESSKCCTQ
jgi:hypothetical protein